MGFSWKRDFRVFRGFDITGNSNPSQHASKYTKQKSRNNHFQSILLWNDRNSRKLIRPILSSHRDNNLFPLNIENRY